MKFSEVIYHLKNIEEVERLISVELPNVEFEQIDIYLEGTLDVESEVKFFDAETIPDKLLIEINGIQYVNLFPLSLVQEMNEEYSSLKDQTLTNLEIAERILEYRIKDA